MRTRWLSPALVWATGHQLRRPERLVIETTSCCNCRCPICAAGEELADRVRGCMDWNLFLGVADEAMRLHPAQVCLHAGGEPLLHPRITDMVRALHERHLPTHLCTNGTLLTSELALDLALAGLGTLVVSHPGVSRENYEACRGQAPREGEEARLAKAMARFCEHGGTLILRTTVLPRFVFAGERGIVEFLRRWLGVPGLWGIEFTGYQPWPGHFREDLLKRVYRVARRCEVSLDSVCVLRDGTLTPCSYDLQGRLAIGRWPEVTLREAYNCARTRQVRKSNFRRSGSADLCRQCLLPRSPAPMAVVRADEWAEVPNDTRDTWFGVTGRRCWQALRA